MSNSFASFGVPADLDRHLADRNITNPFPIQVATLRDAMSGKDVCGQAPTGSGKTLAFGIPLVARVDKGRPSRPKALVLAPTRELAAQIANELGMLAKVRGRTVATFYGGVGFGEQLSALRRGVDIAVACPGRLQDLIERGAVRLDEVGIVVIDEADRMADMGFLPVVRQLLDQVRSDRQTLLFSATLGRDVDQLIKRYQRQPKMHRLVEDDDVIGTRKHLFWKVDGSDRVNLTARIVLAHYSAMVFCRTKRGVDRLVRQLSQSGISAAALHGDRTQAQRDRALAMFRSQSVQVLVGTDVAARGIHVDDVSCVIHFDPPGDEKDYLHRSGRTGRAGASGTVVSLVAHEHAGAVRGMQKVLGLAPGLSAPDSSLLASDAVMASAARTPRRLPAEAANRSAAHRPNGGPRATRGDRREKTGNANSNSPRVRSSSSTRSGAPRRPRRPNRAA